MLRLDRKQENSVKQLSFNKNKLKKNNLRHSKATYQEMTVIGKIVCDSELPGGRGTPHHSGPPGEAPKQSEGRGSDGKT